MACEKIKFWTEEKTEVASSLRNAGYTYKEIGERLGKSVASVNSALREQKQRTEAKNQKKSVGPVIALKTDDLYAIHDMRKRKTFVGMMKRADIPKGISIMS